MREIIHLNLALNFTLYTFCQFMVVAWLWPVSSFSFVLLLFLLSTVVIVVGLTDWLFVCRLRQWHNLVRLCSAAKTRYATATVERIESGATSADTDTPRSVQTTAG